MTRDLLRKVAYEMGWDETSQLDVLSRFVEERSGLPTSFEAWLENFVKAEHEMSDEEASQQVKSLSFFGMEQEDEG